MGKKYLMLLPIRSLMFIMTFFIIALVTKTSINNTATWWTLAVNIVNIITIFILYLLSKNKKINITKLISNKQNKTSLKEIFFVTIAIALLALIGMNFIAFIIYNEIPYTPSCMFQAIPIILAILNIFILPITSSISEELLYLGIGVNSINNNKLKIIVPVFFYILQHSFFPLILDFKFMVFRFFSFLPMVLFMCIYYKKKNNLLPIMAGHFLTNLVTTIELLFLSV